MNPITRITLTHTAVQMAATLVASPLIYVGIARSAGTAEATALALPITLTGTLFTALAMLAFATFRHLALHRQKALVAFYMASKTICMLTALTLIAAYGFTGRTALAAYTVSVLVLYAVMLLNSSTLYARAERKLKANQ